MLPDNRHTKKLIHCLQDLLLQYDGLKQYGVYYGRAYTVLFSYLCYIATKDNRFSDIGDSLLDELVLCIPNDAHWNFSNGYCGYAWLIIFLAEKGLVELDGNDVINNINNKIIECNIGMIEDESFEIGLFGLSY